MEFRTPIKGYQPKFSIDAEDNLFLIGSCFAENIGARLQNAKFNTVINPFGIIFNPISISNSLQQLLNNHKYQENELFENNGIWQSFNFHSRFSDENKENCFQKINQRISEASGALKKTNVLFITLGSAHVYKLKSENRIVANCHKLPAALFEKLFLNFEQTVLHYTDLLGQLHKSNPDLKIILTVSPVRYLSDGFVENQKSKALLILISHALNDIFDFVDYYPAYEIMMDDLRDYRFYNNDMLHPNNQAIEYIFSHFSDSFFSEQTIEMMFEMEQLNKAIQHKVFFEQSEKYKIHCKKMIQKIEMLEMKYPFLNFSKEKDFFSSKTL